MEYPVSPSEKVAAASCGQPALTIEKPFLRDTWLAAFEREYAALGCISTAAVKAGGKAHCRHLCEAESALMDRLNETVRAIRQRGGLLHVGVRGAL